MVSMKDVAREAGVSQPAVSYAYTGSPKISQEMREHVFAVAKRLGYAGPDARGRSLRSGRVGAIGLIVMDSLSYAFGDPWVMSLLKGITSVNDLSNVALTLIPMNNKSLREDAQFPTVMPMRGLIDGLLVSTLPDDHPAIQTIVQQQIPVVIIDSPFIPNLSYVGIDDKEAAKAQINHLISLGHTRIGILVERLIPDNYEGPVTLERIERSNEMIARKRVLGYIEAAGQAGIDASSLIIYEAGGFDRAAGEKASEKLLENSSITGVVATSDVMALSCLSIARKRSLTVPNQLSVVGFDDVPEAREFALTTVRQPTIEKGIYAAQLLLAHIALGKNAEVEKKIFPTELIIRNTTAAPGVRF
ncbi:LacI family DNA-binding transcriptional regulator [Rouxiella sp. Mn2063]|uniref:LacI family DNA-binding transcriptional regulator n=1 Tax=Rouxiella sp. Mn2063 TaxID=3395262 RepID=UPI003BF49626